MEGPRPPFANELSKVVDFLNTNLRPDQSWSITSEYPQTFNERNRANIRIITDQDRILSHAVMKILLIKAPAGIFKVAAIGSVVTDPEHRNKGLSRQVLDDCLASALAQGCDFAILWTDLFDHYRKVGFELAGSEISIVLENEIEAEAPGLSFMESNKVAPESILRLYSAHTVGSLRTAEDIRQYLNIPNCRVYTAWDENNILQAYAVEGRGADLTGYIHEWGGSVSKLIPLFAKIRKTRQQPITIILPHHSINLIHRLQQYPVTYAEGYLGMIKLLDCRNLFFKVHRYARALGIHDFILDRKDDEYIIGVGQKRFRTTNSSDIAKLLFGPHTPSELLSNDLETARVLEQVFPLSMWLWGWDSV